MIEIVLKKELIGAYGSMTIDIELQIEPGHVVTLYGDSGAGKTSTLRMIAGLMKPDTGRIAVDGELWYDASSNRNIPPQSRNIGFVFQDYGLFPNMSVRQNLEFGLRKQQDKTDVEELIDMMALTELQSHKPQTLSGGQKQRVALARALVQRPNLLLLDELGLGASTVYVYSP